MYHRINKKIIERFKEIVGEESCFEDFEIRWCYAFGGTIFEREWIPDLILLPQTSSQISKILQFANINKIPVTTRGSGTSLSGGPMTPYKGVILDLSSRMNKIIKIDVENNLVEVEPGVICDDLNEILKNYGYFFPPDPGSSSVATIGGMVATNAGGIQAFKYGVTKNYVLYLEVIMANGKILTLGSQVLKSVSSYNIKDLFVGSEGTLGIISKIGLRIRPLPKTRKLGFFIFEDIEKIQDIVLEIRRVGIIPNLLEFMDKLILKAVTEYLGGEFFDFPNGYVLLAEIDGDTVVEVEENFSRLFDIVIKKNPLFYKIAKDDQERERLILARKSNLPALSRLRPNTCVEDCTIQITHFTDVIKQIENIPEKVNAKNLLVATICHMEGNLHPTFLFNENDKQDVIDFQNAVDFLYKQIIIPIGGSLTGEHGIGKIKTSFLELEHGSEVVNLMSKVKELFDPNRILNPGIGKGEIKSLKKSTIERILRNLPESVLNLQCMRCGFCIATCPSRTIHLIEPYTPRGRLSILNGLVYGDLKLTKEVSNILNTCTLCALCHEKCPAGIQTHEIFEKAREIIYKKK